MVVEPDSADRSASQVARDRAGEAGCGAPALAQGTRPVKSVLAELCLPRPVALPDHLCKRLDHRRHVGPGKIRDACGTEWEPQDAVKTFEDTLKLRGLRDQDEGLHPSGPACHPLG